MEDFKLNCHSDVGGILSFQLTKLAHFQIITTTAWDFDTIFSRKSLSRRISFSNKHIGTFSN